MLRRSLRLMQPVTSIAARYRCTQIRGCCSFDGPQNCAEPKACDVDVDRETASMDIVHGLPHLTVMLPSRQEKCRFALMPINHKVGDLIEMIKEEDRGVDRAVVSNHCGVRISATSSIESLLDEAFLLQINDKKYKVDPPKRIKMHLEDVNRLSDVRSLVGQLYEVLNVSEYHTEKEKDLTAKLEKLKYDIGPLEEKKVELALQAHRRNNMSTWLGLGMMAMQFGVLARLTWWEYSWDIMEPITYFVTFGTAMGFYAYYCVTKVEFTLVDKKNRSFLLYMHKNAKKFKFDIPKYNELKRQIADLEYDLRRLRDPLNLQMSPTVYRTIGDGSTPAALPSGAGGDSSIPVATSKPDTTPRGLFGFSIPFISPKK